MKNGEGIDIIKGIVSKIVLDSSGVEMDITNDVELVNGGLIDSMSMVTLIQALVGQFNIDIDPSEMTLENFDTVDRVFSFINSKLTIEG